MSTANQPPPGPPREIGTSPYYVRNGIVTWPQRFYSRLEAERTIAGLHNCEVIDSAGMVVTNSEAWWRRQGKDGRP